MSSLLYVAMNIFVAAQWPDYSASQTVSELSAIGAPTRSLWVLPAASYTLLVTAFGWAWSGTRPAEIVIYASRGLPFAPMHLREVLAAGGGTLSDTLHIALGGVTVVLMLLAITVGAAAFVKRFRLFSLASLVILALFGALTFLDAPRVGANLPTPWIGVWERINIGMFLLWVIVLATVLLRAHEAPLATRRRGPVAA